MWAGWDEQAEEVDVEGGMIASQQGNLKFLYQGASCSGTDVSQCALQSAWRAVR